MTITINWTYDPMDMRHITLLMTVRVWNKRHPILTNIAENAFISGLSLHTDTEPRWLGTTTRFTLTGTFADMQKFELLHATSNYHAWWAQTLDGMDDVADDYACFNFYVQGASHAYAG